MIESNWALTVPVSKSEERDGKWIIQGLVSGPGIDGQGDLVTDSAIDRLIDRVNAAPVPFRNFHQTNDITVDLGETISAWKTDDGDMAVEIELDQDNKDAEYLWKKIHKGKQYGLSVHGPAKATFEFSPQAGKRVQTLHDIAMDEISVTTRPAFTKSLGSVVSKSLEEADKEVSTLSETNETIDTTVSKAEEQTSAPEVTESTATEVAVEKSQTNISKDELQGILKAFVDDLNTKFGLTSEQTENTVSTEENVQAEAEKSMSDQTDDSEVLVVVKSLMSQVTEMQSTIESLKEQIPSGNKVPPVVVSKSKQEELDETLEKMNVSERLRFVLGNIYGEK